MAREWLVETMEGILGPEGVISEHEQLGPTSATA